MQKCVPPFLINKVMKTKTTNIFCLATMLVGSSLISCVQLNQSEMTQIEPLRVMSFNIRYGTANDKENHWRHRKMMVAETIHRFRPGLLGVQEALVFQIGFLDEQLEGYARVGVGRDDGEEKGEYTAIYYRQDRFELKRSGHFWLSEKPNEPGSVSWDSSMTRMASWAVLHDRLSDRLVFVLNTHWDHVGKQARLESAALIREKLSKLAMGLPAVLLGDFNSTEDSPQYALMMGAETDLRLVDTYRAAHPVRKKAELTCHYFKGYMDGSRIDWVLVTGEFDVLDAGIERSAGQARKPSDHYPVWAVLTLKDKQD
ncbi:endonuclease/exonuclease/phosphatase family protein [Poriferisphaera sp. WC338]|uniref:endonuclease/exonuclease/phosphatase family protein n=1 Tax=Poriferisphaera sp. WC338 TaxID=3425129 RepID=UPI003D81AC6E